MLTEQDLIDVGFTQHLMLGTGWLSISSMCDAQYYYKSPNKKITINCTRFWTWFLGDEQDNRIAVYTKEDLKNLLLKFDN